MTSCKSSAKSGLKRAIISGVFSRKINFKFDYYENTKKEYPRILYQRNPQENKKNFHWRAKNSHCYGSAQSGDFYCRTLS